MSQFNRIVMAASTSNDLAAYREAAVQVIRELDTDLQKYIHLEPRSEDLETPSGLEIGGAGVSHALVDESDWIVLIVGWHYGKPQPELDGISITHYEFRLAREAAERKRKRLFVFMAGEPGGYNGYQKAAEDPVDLHRWNHDDQSPFVSQMRQFRQEVTQGRFCVIFRDLANFRSRLRDTLRQAALAAVTDDNSQLPGLWALLKEVQPAIDAVVNQVKRISECKEIHDQLHEQLFHGITFLDSVSKQWKQARRLESGMREQVINSCDAMHDRNIQLAEKLKTLQKLASKRGDSLGPAIEAVTDAPDLWDNASRRQPKVADFAAAVSVLAEKLESAFRLADDAIFAESGALDALREGLLEAIEHARQRKPLTAAEDDRLRDGLREFKESSDSLKNTLTRHHHWQQAHDAYQHLMSAPRAPRQRGGVEAFESMRRDFCRVHVSALRRSIEAELIADAVAPTRPPGSAYAPPEGEPVDFDAFDDLLDALEKSPDEERLANFATPFFRAFLLVDKKTLALVRDAKKRVEDFDEDLHDLQNKHLTARSSSGLESN